MEKLEKYEELEKLEKPKKLKKYERLKRLSKKWLSGTETPADKVVTRRRYRLTSSSHAELIPERERRRRIRHPPQ